MYIRVREFAPAAGKSASSSRRPNGAWAAPFRKHPGFLGTELGRDEANAGRYLITGRLTASAAAFEALRSRAAEHAQPDRARESLTRHEREIAAFMVMP